MVSTLLLISTTFLSSILSFSNAGHNVGGNGGQGVVGMYDCLNFRECARRTIDMGSSPIDVNCYGCESCFGSQISTQANIGCQGLAGCMNGQLNTVNDITCGAAGCANTTIYSNTTVYCNDQYSCFNSTLNTTQVYCNSHMSCTFNTMDPNHMYCNGNYSCYRARMVVPNLYVYGYKAMEHSHSFCNTLKNPDVCEFRGRSFYSFFNSSLVSNGVPDMYIHLEVSYSGFGLRIICQWGSTCHIVCYCETCCLNISVQYDTNSTFEEHWSSIGGLSAEATKAKYSTLQSFMYEGEYDVKPYQPIDYAADPIFDVIVEDITKKTRKYIFPDIYQIKNISYGVLIATVVYFIAFFIYRRSSRNKDYDYQRII